MRTTFLALSVFALMVAATSLAEANSEMQCQAEARQITGEIQGLDYTQALTACKLDNYSRPPKAPSVVVIEENAQPDVAFSGSRQVSSGNWVRVSPHRWVLRPN
jgi:hypothetical protein